MRNLSQIFVVFQVSVLLNRSKILPIGAFTRSEGSRVKVWTPFFCLLYFYCGQGLVCMRHGVPEIEMNDDCFHAESTDARRNAVLNASILRRFRS